MKYCLRKRNKKDMIPRELPNKRKKKEKIRKKKSYCPRVRTKFMGKIEKYSRKKNDQKLGSNISGDIIKDDGSNYEMRSQKAFELLEGLKSNLRTENPDEILKKIQEILNFDNTDKILLIECLEILLKFGKNDEFNDLLINSKFCLTKDFVINKKDENLHLLSTKIEKDYNNLLFINDQSIIEELNLAFNNLENAINIFKKIKAGKLKKKQIKNLITFDIGKDTNNRYFIVPKQSENKEENDFLTNLLQFLKLYINVKKFEYYYPNQPINYKKNQTPYLFHIFFKFFETFVIVNKNREKIEINLKNIEIYDKSKRYKNNFMREIENNSYNIDENISREIRFFFLCFNMPINKNVLDNLENKIDSIIKRQNPLKLETIQNFINSSKEMAKIFSIENDNLVFFYKNKKYKFNYNSYNETFLDALYANKDDEIFEQIQWNPLYYYNFYNENDINFLKNLIKKILNSKLFLEIWKEYSDVKGIFDYLFNNEKNIDNLLDNIEFYPYNENDFNVHGLTFYNEMKIMVSGLPISHIINEFDFCCYKILEMARKIIIILHEICHYIKRLLNLITNGEIMNTTIESINENKNIKEAGRLFEKVLFSWKNPYEKTKKNKNEVDNKKIINLNKALKLLNYKIFDNDIENFQKEFYSDTKINKECIDDNLLIYIEKLGFNLEHFLKKRNNDCYNKYSIDCSRSGVKLYYLLYIPDNHNYKH